VLCSEQSRLNAGVKFSMPDSSLARISGHSQISKPPGRDVDLDCHFNGAVYVLEIMFHSYRCHY